MTPLRQRMIEELQRHNYSQVKIESYIFSVKDYAEYFHKSGFAWAQKRCASTSCT